ncbi:MAG TPA: TrbG/VirB9 family P-type conjugative transfer protein, partial [Bryobacteraceae bacterium]|nr:TrbG/VirB9 family P-type conjugative transfer protein [Bryobacteraceae bacterium]
MKQYVIGIMLCGSLVAAAPKKKPEPDLVATIKQGDFSRSIAYDDREIPTVHTRLKYTTVFVLPKSEKAMDILCGDKDAWTINGADGTNFAYVKPEKAGARTNLNLVT